MTTKSRKTKQNRSKDKLPLTYLEKSILNHQDFSKEEDWVFDDQQMYDFLKDFYWGTGIAHDKDKFRNTFKGAKGINNPEFVKRWERENTMSWEEWWEFFFPFFMIKACAFQEKRITNFTDYCPDEFKRFKVHMSRDEHVVWTVLWTRLKHQLGDICKTIHEGFVFNGIFFSDELKTLIEEGN